VFWKSGSLKSNSYRYSSLTFSPLGESLSGACPPESNQRGRHPAITAFGFLALLGQGLSSVPDSRWASIATRPGGLHKTQATAELEQPMAESPHFASATQRDGMGFVSSNLHRFNSDGSKSDSFIKITNGGIQLAFGVPICRAEQRRVDGGLRPSAVRVPQQATFCVACQGEFRWTPGNSSSTGIKRKLGCISFGYLFFVQAKKSNSPRWRKATLPNPQKH